MGKIVGYADGMWSIVDNESRFLFCHYCREDYE